MASISVVVDCVLALKRRFCTCSRPRRSIKPGNGGSAATSALVATLKGSLDDPDAVLKACAELKSLAANPGNQVIAVRDGVMPLLAAALKNPSLKSHQPPIALQLCDLLSCLCDENPDHQAAAATAGTVNALINLVATARASHPPIAAANVAAAGCRALWITIFDCPSNQSLAVKEGVIPVIVALLSSPGTVNTAQVNVQTAWPPPGVIESASKVLRTLTVFNAEHASSARSAGAIEALEASITGLDGLACGEAETALNAADRALKVLRAASL